MRSKGIPFLTLAVALLLSACSAGGSAGTAASGSVSGTAQSGSVGAEDSIVLVGSVLTQPLLSALTESYDGSARLACSVLGRQASLDALQSGEADLALIEGGGDDASTGTERRGVAYLAVAVVANPSCGITGLTAQQVAALFSGESANWADFGGSGGITLIMPTEKDPIRQYFEDTFSLREKVSGILKSRVPEGARLSEQVLRDVAATEGAVGIVPAGDLGALESALAIDGVSLTLETLQSGTYPAGEAVLLAAGPDARERADELGAWLASPAGQAKIAESGFTPIQK